MQVQSSCGFGVPLLSTAPTPEEAGCGEVKPVLLDRDTMGHWSHHKVETNTLLDYQAEMNSRSLDGYPGMRSAMRDRGEKVWFMVLKARMRRLGTEREAILVGIFIGVALLLVLQMTSRTVGIV